MKNLLLTVLFPALCTVCYGQGDQTIINVPINAAGTTTFEAILHLPDDYGTSTTTYPLMMFFHGAGEGGPNPASIYNSSTAGGPAYFIAQGTFPSSFVNPKDGKSYKFIVVSPQAYPQGVEGSTTAQEADYILTYLYAHYRVDTTRVYFTGLSDGGETVVEYAGSEMTNGGNFTRFTKTHHVAAILPMSENASAGLFQEEADSITADKLYAWGFGSTDTQGQNTMQLASYCNNIRAGTMITTSYAGGHCCWGQFYNPTFTQNGMSLYQWALQYTSPVAVPPVTTVTANAGAPQTILLPTNQAMLSGTASTVTNGKIMAYSWTQQSGPSPAVIDSPTAVSTPVKGMSAGANVFALTVMDNTGKTSTATVQVMVDSAPAKKVVVPFAVPGTIQAESYDTMSGVYKQATLDTGGGLNVGSINPGDWMDYAVNVDSAGYYTVKFRIAAVNPGASLEIRTAFDSVLALVPLPATGGFQTWTTVSVVISLPAGSQTLQIYSSGAVDWNFNWMLFASGGVPGQPIPGKIEAETYTSMYGINTQATTDTGGGKNVGWIDLGDWMDYVVNADSAGAYQVNFRIATPYTGAALQLRSASDTVLATVPLPNTGGFQTWTTVSALVHLPAGSQTLQVYSSSSAHWNFNWLQFAADTALSDTSASDAMASTLLKDSGSDLLVLYPNPAKGNFTVRVDNAHMGTLVIQVIDVTGVVRHVQALYKDQPSVLVNMSATDLTPGVYFIRTQIGAWSDVRKLLTY